MSKFLAFAAVAAGLSAAPMMAHAADNGPWVGARIGTLGPGLEVGTDFSPNWSARLIGNGFNLNANRTVDQVRYDGKLKIAAFGAQFDWHPMANGPFFISAGLYSNGNKIDATATPNVTTTIGNLPYTPAQIGKLYAHGKFSGSAPYLGLGGRWPVGALELSVEAGAYFQGKPHVTLTNDGIFATDPTFQAQLEIQRRDLEHDLNDFSTYPVVAVGLGYRF